MRRLQLVKLAILSALVVALLPLSTMFPQVHPVIAATPSNLMLNGDFSNGLLGWTSSKTSKVWGVRGEYPIFEVLKQNPGYSGGTAAPDTCFPSQRMANPFVNIEVPFGADGYIEQSVTIPSNGGARLSFLTWGWEGNNTALGFSGLVNAYVRIDSNNIEHTLETYTPSPMFTPAGTVSSPTAVCTGNIPVLKVYDLSAYPGQQVKIRLGATSLNCCGTNAFFDDVDLEAQGISFHCPSQAGFQALPNSCAIPNAIVGTPYSYNFQITGGLPPYTGSLFSPSDCCPPGMIVGGTPAQISGTPTRAGVYPLIFSFSDSGQGQFKNFLFIAITFTVTPIITNVEPYSGVLPSAGPAQGGTAVNITGVGFKGACFINGACISVKSVKFGSHDVNAGTFHLMNDTRIKVDSSPENQVCSPFWPFCNDEPGLANVTVVSTVCFASSGKCNDYSSGFWCPTPVNQTITPRCNQFKYIQRDQQLICSSKAPGGLLPFSVPSIGVDFKTLDWKTNVKGASVKANLDLSGDIDVTPQVGFCVQIDRWNLKSFNFTSVIDVTASLKATASLSAEYDNLDRPYVLGHPISGPVLTAGPIIMVPTLTPVLMIEASAEASVTVGISHSSEATFGIAYNPPSNLTTTTPSVKCVDPVTGQKTKPDSTLCIRPSYAVSVSGSMKITIGFQFSLLFYDLAGPVITPALYLRLDAGGSSADPAGEHSCDGVPEGTKPGVWLALCGGLQVGVGFQLNPWLGILHLIPDDWATNWNPIPSFDVKSVLLAATVSVKPSTIQLSPGESVSLVTTVAGSELPRTANGTSWVPRTSTNGCGGGPPAESQTNPGTFTYTAPSPETCSITFSKNFLGFLDSIIGNDGISRLTSTTAHIQVGQPPFGYYLSNSGNIIVRPGGSGSLTITATLTSGTAQSISLSCSGLPTGGSCSFNPASVSPTGSSVLTVSTSSSSPTGSFPVTATGNPLGRTTIFTLMVNALSAPSAPQNPTATGQLGQILIQWQPPLDDGGSPVIWYVLYSGTSPSDLHVCGHTCANAITRTSYTDRSVDCQATYYYAVSAVNAMYLEGPQSTEVNASPFCAPTVSISPTKIDIGQSSAVSTTTSFGGGGSAYLCQWLRKSPSDASYSNLGSSFSCNAGDLPTRSTGILSATGTWSFELQVTDIGNPAEIVTSDTATVTVTSPSIAVVINPNSGRVTVDGTSITELTVYRWQPGSSHIIVANSIYSPNAGTRLTFVKWNDGNTSNPRIVVVAQPAVYSADWQTQFRLDVASQHSPSQELWKNQDESVAVSAPATADDNGQGTRYKCAGWSGTGSVPTQGSECSVTFTISQPSNLTWTWRIQYLLTVTANPSSVHAPGVSSEPWWVDEGKQVTLSAPDVQGMIFEYWTAGSSRYPDGQRSITISLENAETATANYSATPTPIWVYVAIASAILGVATTFMVFRRSRLKTRRTFAF